MTKILVVDDEPTYRETLEFNLTRDGFDVLTAPSGPEAVVAFRNAHPDLILLDLMLPGMSGEEVFRKVRDESDVPVIMLTAKDSEIDRVVGLELGADDYVTKPYSYRELLARIRAILRRLEKSAGVAGGGASASADVLSAGGLELDVAAHEVRVNGEPVAMPLREFELLELLMENLNRVLTRTQIFDALWGVDYIGDPKTLDVHVKRIRSKIEEDPANPRQLVTVRGLGYKLLEHPEK
ncbi:two-component system response regulator RegX3 [Arcanobacterium wilhelmae]|uniref:Sensory transduction protein RegX3 n=1 Tax=Arcanobacterium wilhelmae TaxID=1803177 RepID=A0ABT9NBL6_9ACTO|nr:response regulator transcription factor [Arcanobacterium wilhelmae]MDP9801114.1 two-component system response regulator RegX3 [Arcanobacterium wilhelmae]WFN90468.1 response regulator transcription factor [Arcanobacterium wilhelmae]